MDGMDAVFSSKIYLNCLIFVPGFSGDKKLF